SDVDEAVELDVSSEATLPGDESLVFDSAQAPADVWSHAPYNKSFTFVVPLGRLAQLEERQLDMLEVGGSRPSPPTNRKGFRTVVASGALSRPRIDADGSNGEECAMEEVAPAGFEPAISALKGPRPRPLDDGASLEV